MKLIWRGALASSRLDRILLCAALLLGTAAQVASAQAPQEIETTMKYMLAATQAKSLADFVAGGDGTFRSKMTQPMLDSFGAQPTPRLHAGYTAAFLARLNQGRTPSICGSSNSRTAGTTGWSPWWSTRMAKSMAFPCASGLCT